MLVCQCISPVLDITRNPTARKNQQRSTYGKMSFPRKMECPAVYERGESVSEGRKSRQGRIL